MNLQGLRVCEGETKEYFQFTTGNQSSLWMALVEFTVILKNPWFYSWHTRGSKNSADFFFYRRIKRMMKNDHRRCFVHRWIPSSSRRKMQLFYTDEPGLLLLLSVMVLWVKSKVMGEPLIIVWGDVVRQRFWSYFFPRQQGTCFWAHLCICTVGS